MKIVKISLNAYILLNFERNFELSAKIFTWDRNTRKGNTLVMDITANRSICVNKVTMNPFRQCLSWQKLTFEHKKYCKLMCNSKLLQKKKMRIFRVITHIIRKKSILA